MAALFRDLEHARLRDERAFDATVFRDTRLHEAEQLAQGESAVPLRGDQLRDARHAPPAIRKASDLHHQPDALADLLRADRARRAFLRGRTEQRKATQCIEWVVRFERSQAAIVAAAHR